MDLTNIKTNQVIKNYRLLCSLLNEPIKAGNSKKAHLNEIQRYCKLNQVGHSFTVLQIYDTPLPKSDNRGGNNNTYNNLIQLLILDLLAQCPNGHVSISRSKLMLTINMINSNYSPCNEIIPKLSQHTHIQESTIYDFYNTSNSNFKSTIETSLNKLMDKRIILYNPIVKICEYETNIHRAATNEEKETILETEKTILKQYGFSEVSHIRCSKYWRQFKRKVQLLLNQKSNIEYYYRAYDITINKKYIDEERKTLSDLLLQDLERMEYKQELNVTIYDHLIENAKKRYKPGLVSGKMGKVRANQKYIDHIKKLVCLLIDDNTSYIIDDLMKNEIEDTYKIDYFF